jgi:hypothetical protein
MKLFALSLLLIAAQVSFAQIKVTKLDKKDIPATIKYTGHIINAVKYTDNDGQHLIITTETGITPTKSKDPGDTDFRDAALYAYCYTIGTNNELKLSWQTYDFIKDCSLDLEANYVPNTFAVTDLNNDGKAEVWLMYTTACTGDVSPPDMKIIMHEGLKKYAVRGTKKVKVSDKDFEGGKFTYDEAFKAGPEAFIRYAVDLWKKNSMQVWQ